MAMLVIVCVTVFGVWSTRDSGLAGMFERLAIMIPMVWMYTFLRRLEAGTPFMVAPRRVELSGETWETHLHLNRGTGPAE